MAHKRGIFAEMQHQAQISAKHAEQRRRAAIAEQQRAERARAAAVRNQQSLERASEADRKRFEKEAAAAHLADMQAEAEELTAALQAEWAELEGLLAATLLVDDFVDLEALRLTVEHPPFDREDVEVATPLPAELPDPTEPVLGAVAQSKALFGRKQKQEQAEAKAKADFEQAHEAWAQRVAELPAERAKAKADYEAMEAARLNSLKAEKSRYEAECSEREKEVAVQNEALDKFIADLSYGTVEAVQEYVGIVLAHSVYPEHFLVESDAEFDPSTAELRLKVVIPPPSDLSPHKGHKYVRASDEIVPVPLTQKEAKDRYSSVVHQVALRTLQEVFEADRRSLIQSISLELGTDAQSPATGKNAYVPFVAVDTSREKFSEIDLSAVVPSATLGHLGAAVSKNPFDLAPAVTTGVRRS